VVEWLEYRLHGWVSFVVMPVFALANAGVALGAHPLQKAVTSRLGLGIIVGLVVGKIVGIVAVSLLVVRLGWSRLPDGSTVRSLCGVAALAGIGFTVALFVAELAVKTPAVPGVEGTSNGALGTAKLAILLGSLLAAAVGSIILMSGRRPDAAPSATVPEL
jgi:NhaA family Na+:H+ antiporter